MAVDYRTTKYFDALKNISDKKDKVKKLVKKDHPRAEDLHTYLSKNDLEYKTKFMKAYDNKCGYCGVSSALIPKSLFEIDHYIYRECKKFSSKKEAGYIENLVLSCHDCNSKKKDFLISDEIYNALYPDGEKIGQTFYRNSLFYIKISDDMKKNLDIAKFYKKLQLGGEIQRLDYLLMNMMDFQEIHKDQDEIYNALGKVISILHKKRNCM